MAKESNNKSFVLRIDAATMDALELWAADEFRSINGQLQWIIADALRRSGRLKKPPGRPCRPRIRALLRRAGPSRRLRRPFLPRLPPLLLLTLRPVKARRRCRMPSLPLPLRQPGRPARCLRTPVCSPTTRKKIKPI